MNEKREYTDEFKFEVVNSYLNNTYGVRVTARSFNLPSKNYIGRWIKELIEKGLLTEQICSVKCKSSETKGKKQDPYKTHEKTPRERQLEHENEILRAEVAFLKKLEEIERRDAPERKDIKP